MISQQKLDKLIRYRQCLLIDVRSTEEYEKSHILTSVNIPYRYFENKRILEKLRENHVMIVLYCNRGGRSTAVADTLLEHNIPCKTLFGGIDQYHGNYFMECK